MSTQTLELARQLLERCSLPVEGIDDQFGGNFVVLVENDAAVALAGIEEYGKYGLLRSVAVAPECRTTGVGRRVVEDRLAWARTRGLQALFLLTTTAAGYFPKFGFKVVSRDEAPEEIRQSREFRSTCPASAVFMRLDLHSD